MPCVAPNFLANSSLSSNRSTTMIGYADRLAHACTTDSPTPPTPMMTHESPGRTFAALSAAPAPVITAQPMIEVTSVATSGVELDHHLLVGNRVARPGEGPDKRRPPELNRLALVGHVGRRGQRRIRVAAALDPRDHDVVALFDVRHVLALGDHHARRLVPEHQRQRRIGIGQLMQLRMAHAGRELLDHHMRRPGIRQIDVVDHHRLTSLRQNRGSSLHRHK